MKLARIILFFLSFLTTSIAFSQVRDSIPLLIADSLKTVYIYADTGRAINGLDNMGRKEGLWEKRYPNGKLRYRGHFLHDIPTGVFKYYWNNDSIQNITTYSESGKVARTKMFYENGGLLAIGKFIDKKEDSVWVRYTDQLKLISKEQYTLGKKDGKFITFYPNGAVYEVKTWKNGLESGKWQEFFDDGQLKLESSYVNGKRQGPMNVYDLGNTDSPVIQGNYMGDLKEGQWIFYNALANVRDTVIYHKDMVIKGKRTDLSPEKLDSLRQQYQEFQQKLENPGKGQDGADPEGGGN